MKTSIVLVDDHPIVREGLTNLLNSVSGFEVVADAGNEQDGIAAIRKFDPRIAIVDLMLGDRLAFKFIEQIGRDCPHTKVVCISMHADAAYAEPAALAGALGYVNKAHASRTIIQAIESVINGVPFFSAEIQRNLLHIARGVRSTASPLSALSPREIEVLQCIGQGLTKQQIAARIDRSPNTVEAHRSNIKRKLGLESNADLIRFSTLHLPAPAQGKPQA